MKKNILEYICKAEGWKTAIKSLHWDAKNLSQHKLCDEIAEEIASFQDTVAEIEQAINGNLEKGKLSAIKYEITTLDNFVKDVIKDTNAFYKTLSGEEYVGIKSECEAFLGKMQKLLYLTNFTLQEEFIKDYKERHKINEADIPDDVIGLSENQIKQIIKESILNVLRRF